MRKGRSVYRLMQIKGIAPVVEMELARSQDWSALYVRRDELLKESLSDGPGSLEKLRYGVWPV